MQSHLYKDIVSRKKELSATFLDVDTYILSK